MQIQNTTKPLLMQMFKIYNYKLLKYICDTSYILVLKKLLHKKTSKNKFKSFLKIRQKTRNICISKDFNAQSISMYLYLSETYALVRVLMAMAGFKPAIFWI